MDMTGALIGLDSYYKAGDARREREYLQARRDAELSLLPDKINADRSGYVDTTEENQARRTLRPQRTANESAQLGLAGNDLKSRGRSQDDELRSRENAAKIDAALKQFGVDDLPRVLGQMRIQGAMDDATLGTTVLLKLDELIRTGDSEQIVKFLNGVRSSGIKQGEQPGAPIAAVGAQEDPKTKQRFFVARDQGGNEVMRVSREQLDRIRSNFSKSEYKTVNAGDTLVQVGPGGARPVYTAPESARSTAAKQGPLERDVAYLAGTHGMTPQQALGYLNSAKTMTRQQFILNGAQNIIAMGKQPTDVDLQKLGQMYDTTTGGPSPGLGTTSNSRPAGTMDPQIKSLLGLP